MVRYYHVTYTPLNFDTPTASPNPRVKNKGKPVGLWYAEGEDWIKVLDTIEEDEDKFNERLRIRRPPRGPRLKYEFPLDGKFVDDINSPTLDKIFRLTSANMDAFESKFQTFFTQKLSKIQQDIEYYNRRLAEREKPKDIRDPKKSKPPSLATIMLPLQKSVDIRTPYIPTDPAMSGTAYWRAVQAKLYELITNRQSGEENGILFTTLRLIQYGDYYEEVMRPIWGGIHYDVSLFTPELKAKYPYIQYVEIPSGCLWHPKEVMPGYVPTPVSGGKRTRRKKLRKSTRRRR
jgi:hypothetical protein